MNQHLSCPTCLGDLSGDPDRLLCSEGHNYTSLALALATNSGTVRALWRAIRALEDDAAGLTYLAGRQDYGSSSARLAEAAEAREAAFRLREHAAAAQRRLNVLAADLA
jgi:hypothetical protein